MADHKKFKQIQRRAEFGELAAITAIGIKLLLNITEIEFLL
jgi:hypothetical protein